jgi:serine/threonine protein kinase
MESVLLNNRYHLRELVGSGGMAAVYRGIDTLLQRQVAVKVLRKGFASDPAFLARFQREARAAANLDHPNVVTVYDVGQDGDRHYIVMEYVDGQDLKTLIRRKGRLYVNETLDITVQICAGVGHAHKAGIIHCDIKPQNVLITTDGRAKVTDFGIARALSESGITESSTVWGSPLYFSPEQAAGEPPSPASDVYSIGVMMYEMLAGAPPFQAEKPAALALMHMREEPQPLAIQNPQVPSQLERIVRKVLAKEPSARYRTAEQLGHILAEYRRQSEQLTGWQPAVPGLPPAVPTPPASVAEAEPPPVPRMSLDGLTWTLGVIAFVAVVGLVPLWSLVYRTYSTRPTLPRTPVPTPLVTFTPEVQLISVPNILGKPREEAQEMLARAGLRFALLEERDEPDAERDIVLEQSPAPDELVPFDTEVSVVVSGSGRELTMPGVVDYPVDLVQDGLESDGLRVAIDRVWSAQPEGMVLKQEPEQGTAVYAGDTVTLTVSGGVDIPIPLEVNLAHLITLESAELRQETFPPGGVIAVTLRWRAQRSIDAPYVVFVHLIGPDGNLVAQQDIEPLTPTTAWTPGVESVDPHQVTIPRGQPTGLYQLRAGMYPQGQPHYRLPVVDEGLTTAESDSILIAEIEVKP